MAPRAAISQQAGALPTSTGTAGLLGSEGLPPGIARYYLSGFSLVACAAALLISFNESFQTPASMAQGRKKHC